MWIYKEKLNELSSNNILDLDDIVLWALDLFSEQKDFFIPEFDFKKPVIIWSWNAINTAKIIYEWKDVVFSDENDFKKALSRKDIDWVVIFSASWWKHAAIISKYAKDLWLDVKLITCNKESDSARILEEKDIFITPKNKEPYTYNTSTYMWWILAITKENPRVILDYLVNNFSKQIPRDLSKYDWYLFIIPNKFALLQPLLEVKFIELFWRNISRDIKTFEQAKHAITVVPYENELCVKFWKWDLYFNWDILQLDIPDDIGYAFFMAIWYYFIWNIQKQHKPYFKENIGKYIEYLTKSDFWKWMNVIV